MERILHVQVLPVIRTAKAKPHSQITCTAYHAHL